MVMTVEQITVTFLGILEEFAGVSPDEVTSEADLASDLNVDSLSMVEVINSAQAKFAIEIPDTDLKYLRTVQDVIEYVQRVQRAGVSA